MLAAADGIRITSDEDRLDLYRGNRVPTYENQQQHQQRGSVRCACHVFLEVKLLLLLLPSRRLEAWQGIKARNGEPGRERLFPGFDNFLCDTFQSSSYARRLHSKRAIELIRTSLMRIFLCLAPRLL